MNNVSQLANPVPEKRMIILFVTAVLSVMAGLATLLAQGTTQAHQMGSIGGLMIATGLACLGRYLSKRKDVA